jgi:hypothetical protein
MPTCNNVLAGRLEGGHRRLAGTAFWDWSDLFLLIGVVLTCAELMHFARFREQRKEVERKQ